jgi:hypothetical protein
MTRKTNILRIPSAFWVAFLGLLGWAGCAPLGDPDQPSTQAPEAISKPQPAPIAVPDSLKERVKAAIDHVNNRTLLTSHSFWTVFHSILGNGLDTKIRDTWTNKEYCAIQYVRDGGPIKGLEFIVHENIADGKDGIDVKIGPTFYGQGHRDQFVAEMTQLGMPLDTVFKIPYKTEVREYTFASFVHYSKVSSIVYGDEEFSWTILIVSQFFGTQVSWTNTIGQKVNFEDLVKHEVEQPIESAACGGTHRLFGLTWAYYIHLRDGGKMTPVWQAVDARLKKYCENARTNQNSDGSFSTEYFRGPGHAKDADRQIGTTGHIVEWLALYLPDEELRAPWMQSAVNSLVLMILENQNKLLDSGSIYHAAHGLHLYYHRVWGAEDASSGAKAIPLPPKK